MTEQSRKAPASYKAFRIVAGMIVIAIAAVGGFVIWDMIARDLLATFL